MNTEYIYSNEEAIVRNEEGEKKPIKYYNELDKVLEHENLIEAMEKRTITLELAKKGIKIDSILEILSPVLMGVCAPFILIPLLSLIGITNPYSTITNTIFGPMMHGVFMSMTTAIVCGGMGLYFTITSALENTHKKKDLLGIESQLEYLKNNIDKEKEKLDEFNKSKSYEHENKKFRIVKINDEAIKKLNTKLMLYYACGYDGKKYYKIYKKNNQLPKELVQRFKNGEIEIIKEFLEEKGPVLRKRK